MHIEILADGTLVGERSYSRGDRAEVADGVAHRLVRARAAAVVVGAGPVESADAPAAPESADANPGKRRKA